MFSEKKKMFLLIIVEDSFHETGLTSFATSNVTYVKIHFIKNCILFVERYDKIISYLTCQCRTFI